MLAVMGHPFLRRIVKNKFLACGESSFSASAICLDFSINHQIPQCQLALFLFRRSSSVEVLTTRNKWISGLYSGSLMDDGPLCNAMGCMISSRPVSYTHLTLPT